MKYFLLTAGLLGLASCKKSADGPARVLTADEQQLVGTWRLTRRATALSKQGVGLVKDSVSYLAPAPTLTCRADGSYQNDSPSLFYPTNQGQFTYARPTLVLTSQSGASPATSFTFTYTVLQLTGQSLVVSSRVNNDPNQYEAFSYVK